MILRVQRNSETNGHSVALEDDLRHYPDYVALLKKHAPDGGTEKRALDIRGDNVKIAAICAGAANF